MKTKNTQETYDYLCNTLDNNSKVYYGRFGDGDFYIMNGRREKMHKWSPELQQELRDAIAIEDMCYIRGAMVNYPKEPGMAPGVFAPPTDNAEIENWLLNNQKIDPDTIFDSHIMFHYISVFKQDLMINFLNKYIRPKKKMFIGCVDKYKIEKLVGKIDYYIQVPEQDAYYSIDKWWPEVLKHIDDVELCLPAAGMAGRVINKRLWKLNKNIHSIDIGSVIDAAVGSSTRTWIDRVGNKIDNLLIKNINLPVYIWTSNQLMHCLPAWAYLFNKHWPCKTNVKILGYNIPEFDLPDNFEYISLGKQRGPEFWSDDMINYFSKCNDEYFYLTTEDGFIIHNVNARILDYACELVCENLDSNILRVCLTKDRENHPHNILQDFGDFQLIESEQSNEYRHSLQHSIWNRKNFLKVLSPGHSPWSFELSNKGKNDGYTVLGMKTNYALHVGHGYKKGHKIKNWHIDVHDNTFKLSQDEVKKIESNNWVPEI